MKGNKNMKRTQIYLESEQHKFLETMSFYLSQKENRKVSMSEIIRQAIERMIEENKNIHNETQLIIEDSNLLNAILTAKKEKEFYSHDEVFGD